MSQHNTQIRACVCKHGATEARALATLTPAAIGPEYFREAAAVLAAAAGGPPDRAKMAEVMRRYGLTPAVAPAHPARAV